MTRSASGRDAGQPTRSCRVTTASVSPRSRSASFSPTQSIASKSAVEDRAHLAIGVLRRFRRKMAPLAVPDQRRRGAGAARQRDGRRAGERALGLPVDVLRAGQQMLVPAQPRRCGLQRNGRREERHGAPRPRPIDREKALEERARLARREVHLPVGGEEERARRHASSSAATPGSGFPSRNSSEAPPPVETCVTCVLQAGRGDRRGRIAAADDRHRAAASSRPPARAPCRACPDRTAASRTRPSARSRSPSSPLR